MTFGSSCPKVYIGETGKVIDDSVSISIASVFPINVRIRTIPQGIALFLSQMSFLESYDIDIIHSCLLRNSCLFVLTYLMFTVSFSWITLGVMPFHIRVIALVETGIFSMLFSPCRERYRPLQDLLVGFLVSGGGVMSYLFVVLVWVADFEWYLTHLISQLHSHWKQPNQRQRQHCHSSIFPSVSILTSISWHLVI